MSDKKSFDEGAGHENDQLHSHKEEELNETEQSEENTEPVEEAELIDEDEESSDSSSTSDDDIVTEAENIVNDADIEDEKSHEETEAEGDNYLEDLQRLQAEYVNYRKRVERDRAVAGEMATQRVLEGMLPVFDDIDAARAHGDLEDGPFASIAQKLETTLAKFGLDRYDDVGVAFDPLIHETLIQQPSSEVEVETVAQVLRAGYKINDKVIRAAQVIVSVPEQ
ncbi:MAG: nucleotide exchange factor GrpE [Micrococcaceae bacterium]